MQGAGSQEEAGACRASTCPAAPSWGGEGRPGKEKLLRLRSFIEADNPSTVSVHGHGEMLEKKTSGALQPNLLWKREVREVIQGSDQPSPESL